MEPGIIDKLKKHWLICLVVLFSSGVGVGWNVSKALLVEPRDFEIARLERVLSIALPYSTDRPSVSQEPNKVIERLDLSDKKENAQFNVFMMYYPSKKVTAQSIHKTIVTNGFSLKHFQEEPEESLSPRISEIIFYSVISKNKSEELRDLIYQDIGTILPLSKSPYYGDKRAIHKIYINIF